MTNTKSRTVVAILGGFSFLFAIAPATSIAQDNRVAGLAGRDSGLRLSIAATGNSFRAGESIKISADFRNIAATPSRIAVIRPSELYFQFSIVRMNGEHSATPAQPSSFGKERMDQLRYFGTRSWMVGPNKGIEETLDVAALYLLPSGNYKLACYIDMPTSDKVDSSKLRYVSNELNFVVVP